RAVPSEPGRYELPWEGDPGAVRTLRSLRTDLERAAQAGKFSDPEHPLLRELDEVAAALCTLAAQLHEAHWSLGLVQPDSVIIRGPAGGREVILTDLGFAWRGSFGSPPWEDSPGRPDWLDPFTPNRWLWDHEPVRQQFADPQNGAFPPPGPVSDVRTLGRLFAWLISGQTSRDVPMVGGPDGPPPAWRVLADAAAGRIPSADAPAARLPPPPLSDYFAPPLMAELPPSGGGAKWLIPVALLGLLALAGAGVGVWYAFIREKPTETASGNPDNKSPDKPPDPAAFDQAVQQFTEAQKKGDFSGMFAALAKMAKSAPTDKKAEVDARRVKAIEDWTAAVNETIQRGQDPSQRLEVAARLDELEAQLKALIEAHPATDPSQQEKEQQCLDFVATFARQFGPPR